jgi:asparagine synthase (glutamine-hydrolysing)
MCGIAGAYHFRESGTAEPESVLLQHALDSMRHRGPDHQGIANFSRCQLGHVRLKILDLTDAANQPMADPFNRYHLIFNGEIFNHAQLRDQLIAEGHTFNTRSDTEVLLRLLISHGEHALNMLNGFFAFAFYDSESQQLMVVRDRYGEKPIYYTHDHSRMYFASELGALQCFDIPHEPDVVSLASLMQFTYIPAPATVIKDVKKLEPGCLLVAGPDGVTKKKWYHPPIQDISRTTDSASGHFRDLLNDAVRLRLSADVPAAIFLSGGIDSSVIAALSAAHNPDIVSYSIAFPDAPYFDESKYAAEVASFLGIRNEIIPLAEDDMLQEFKQMLESGNEPFADSSAIAFGALARQASGKTRIALTGDGADELLGGYNKHRALLSSVSPGLLNKLLPLASPLLKLIPSSRNNFVMNKLRQAEKYASILQDNIKERYVKLASWNNQARCQTLIRQDVSLRLGARINNFVQDIDPEILNSILLADQQLVLANDMLMKTDRMSMLHSLEIRSPFLDFRVVEFINSLPFEMKATKKEGKIILRQAFSRDLPDQVFNRPKRGFEIPLDKWLRGQLKNFTRESLSSSNLSSAAFLNQAEIDKLLREYYLFGKSEHAHLIYCLLLFELWHRKKQKR